MYYEKENKCKMCLKKYKSLKMRMKTVKINKEDSDFMPRYENETVTNPMFYDIFICPHCGMVEHSMMKRNHEPFLTLIREGYIDKIIKRKDYTKERTLDEAIMAYQLAYYVAVIAKEENNVIGTLLLKLSWLYRIKKNEEKEFKFLKAARDTLIESQTTTKESEEKSKYLFAEISLRIGDIDGAKKMFSKIFTDNTMSAKYKNLAKKQWEDYQELERKREKESMKNQE